MAVTGNPMRTVLRWAAIPLGAACLLGGLLVQSLDDNASLASVAVWAPMGFGLLLLGVGVFAAWREARSGAAVHRFRIGLNVAAMCGLAFLALVLGNAAVAMRPQTDSWFLDCTAGRVHTLSRKTLNILNSLDADARMTVLIGDGIVTFRDQGDVALGPVSYTHLRAHET